MAGIRLWTGVAALVAGVGLVGCSDDTSRDAPVGDDRSATSTAAGTTGVDPGVRAVTLEREVLGGLRDAAKHAVVTGTVTRSWETTPDGDTDSFLALHVVTVKVDRHLTAVRTPQEIDIHNGYVEYERAVPASSGEGDRQTESGQPWLKAGDEVLLVLGDTPDRQGGRSVWGAFSAGGTFRVVDGRVDVSPRRDDRLDDLARAIDGSTIDEVEARLKTA